MRSYNCLQFNKKESKKIEKTSSLLKLLSEKNRLRIICILRKKERCVCEIKDSFNISQSLTSHHLSDLQKAGLVDSRREGRRKYYSLTKKGKEISDLIINL